jgi:[ribosomal protein S5]-alanine N-acetyltransferase
MLPIRIERFPTIETKRLLLREIVVSDTETLFALRNNQAITRYLGRDDDKDSSAVKGMILKMRRDLEAGAGVQWGISLCDSNELIGVVCLWRIDKRHHRAEIGFMLRPESWRQGIMSEAIEAVLAYAFHTLRLHSLEANTSVANLASQAVLIKCGFIQEAHFRENWHYKGTFTDSLIFCKLTDVAAQPPIQSS